MHDLLYVGVSTMHGVEQFMGREKQHIPHTPLTSKQHIIILFVIQAATLENYNIYIINNFFYYTLLSCCMIIFFSLRLVEGEEV